MTLEEYRGALDRAVPAPGLKERILAAQETAPARPAPRRGLRTALAVAAAAACLFTAALAASPGFRAAVLTLLHLEEPEQVPAPTAPAPDGPELTCEVVAGQVEAQYIRLPGAAGYSYGNGVLYQVERDGSGAPLSVRWWAAEGDELVPLEGRATAFSTAWEGMTYADTVYWCIYDGAINCYCSGTAGLALDYDCTVSPLAGHTDGVLLTLSQGSQMAYREYPVLLDLETGAVTGLLDGAGWEGAAPLREVQWSSDLSAALLSGDRSGWSYCDRAAKTTTSLDELTGLEVFSAWFAPDDALLLLTRSGPEGACYDVWRWDPAEGTLTRTLPELPVYPAGEGTPHGFRFFFGGSRGLYLTEDGRALVLDLTSGEVLAEAGLPAELSGCSLVPNPSGDKLLCAAYDSGAEGLGVSALGVLDLEQGTFTLLDRENYAALREGSLGWFDEDRVAISAHGADSYEDAYLYLYRF